MIVIILAVLRVAAIFIELDRQWATASTNHDTHLPLIHGNGHGPGWNKRQQQEGHKQDELENAQDGHRLRRRFDARRHCRLLCAHILTQIPHKAFFPCYFNAILWVDLHISKPASVISIFFAPTDCVA